MSDELPPPPLRLKPRPKIETENAAPTPAEVQPAAEVAINAPSESAPPRLKLRPKLAVESAPAEVIPPPSPAEPVPPAAPSISLKPRLSIAQPTSSEPTIAPPTPPTPEASKAAPASIITPPAPEPPKFKLKEKAPLPAADVPPVIAQVRNTVPTPFPPPPRAAAQVTSTPPPVPPRSNPPPTFPVVASASPEQAATPLPPILPKSAVHSAPEATEAADPGRSSLAKIILVVAAVVLVAGGYFGYKTLTESTAANIPETPIAKEAPKRPASPSKTLNEIGAIPAQAIKKAEEVVAAVQANEVAAVEDVLATETFVPPPRRKAVPKPAENPAAPVTSTTELSPGIRATTIADVDGEASPEFRAWVAQVRISGVFQGTPARVLINGKTVPAGQLVDEALGITFDSVDPTTKSLVFRDGTGATVARKF